MTWKTLGIRSIFFRATKGLLVLVLGALQVDGQMNGSPQGLELPVEEIRRENQLRLVGFTHYLQGFSTIPGGCLGF